MRNQSVPFVSSIILGIDPGSAVTGYGVIAIQSHGFTPIDYGCIRPPRANKLSERFVVIYDSIGELIEIHNPDAVVVEMQFFYKNAQSALTLGMAKGAVMIASKKKGVPVFHYSPPVAKKAVTGTGRASKYQVQRMVQQRLNLAALPPADSADALALAICHAQAAEHVKARKEV